MPRGGSLEALANEATSLRWQLAAPAATACRRQGRGEAAEGLPTSLLLAQPCNSSADARRDFVFQNQQGNPADSYSLCPS